MMMMIMMCVCVFHLMFILWVLNPSNGSSTRLVAKSSVSHSSLTLILYDPSMFAHHPHAEKRRTRAMSGRLNRIHNNPDLHTVKNHSIEHQHHKVLTDFISRCSLLNPTLSESGSGSGVPPYYINIMIRMSQYV